MLKLIIDMAAGALSGATGGKVDLGRAVTQAVSKAVQSPETALKRQDAPAVAEAIREALPAPQAMESLWPQIMRILVVLLGGILIGMGIASGGDLQAIMDLANAVVSGDSKAMVGAVTAAVPIVWRIGSTLLARRQAKV